MHSDGAAPPAMTPKSPTPPQGRWERPQTDADDVAVPHTRAQERVLDVLETLSAAALSTLLSAPFHPGRTIPQVALDRSCCSAM
jgi:hypothetical protein